MGEYNFDFSYDDGKWNLSNASITGGVLYVALIPWTGSGRRVPDWGSGAYDNFEIEIDFRRKMIDNEPTINSWWRIGLDLIGVSTHIQFIHETTVEELHIEVDGEIVASKSQDMNDINWHSIKVRRVGTIYYVSVDGESEISYDHEILRGLEDITFGYKHSLPHSDDNGGHYDNFKYSWLAIEQDYAFIM